MKKYVCDVCGYIYDEAVGDPDNGIEEREEAWADGHSAGITEGRAENQRLTARNLQQMNMPPEQIAQAVGADIDTVRKWLSDS